MSQDSSEVVTGEPAALRAYRALERMIVTLDLAPGSITTEGALIERVGLGRTPVREAIQRLAWEGLISVRPRTGLAIAPLDRSDWVKIVDARRGVEVVLARSAARWLSPDATTALENAARAMHAAVLAGDVAGFLEADKSLDEAMAEAADNRFASRLAAPLQSHSRRFWFRFRGQDGVAESAGHHVALIQAILARDEEAAGAEADRLMMLLRRYAEEVALP